MGAWEDRETKILLDLYQANLEWITHAFYNVSSEIDEFERILEDVRKRKIELDKRLEVLRENG